MSELYIKDIDNKISDILSLYIEQGDTNYFGEILFWFGSKINIENFSHLLFQDTILTNFYLEPSFYYSVPLY